eukprot:3539471-Rhodomonas_salina.2
MVGAEEVDVSITKMLDIAKDDSEAIQVGASAILLRLRLLKSEISEISVCVRVRCSGPLDRSSGLAA